MPQPAREVEVEVLPKDDRVRRFGAGGPDDPLAAIIARIMDSLFTIPGTKVRFGLDPLLSLIPAAGSPLSAFVSLLMIARGAQQGVPNIILGRMGMNVILNAILDALPVIGGPLSIFYRSNARNHELMKKYAGTRRPATFKDKLFLLGLLLGVILFVVIIIVGAFVVLQQVWNFITGGPKV